MKRFGASTTQQPFFTPVRQQSAPTASNPLQAELFIIRQRGDCCWDVSYQGVTHHLFSEGKGIKMIEVLVNSPNCSFPSIDLIRIVEPLPPDASLYSQGYKEDSLAVRSACSGGGDGAGEALDSQAKAEYRQRTIDLQHELEEAQAYNDLVRAQNLREELEFLQDHLAKEIGFGRSRPLARSDKERARQSVQRALKTATAKIKKELPVLGNHLQETLRTGIWCMYRQSPTSRIFVEFK